MQNSERYLTEKEHEIFDSFLRQRKVRRTEVARILKLKSSGSINGYFERKTLRRDDAKKVKKVLKDKALEGFEVLEFLE